MRDARRRRRSASSRAGSPSPRPGRSACRCRSTAVLDGIAGGGAERARRAAASGFAAGDHDHRPRAEALHGARRRSDRLRPGEGRGNDRAGLRDHALLRADRCRRRRPRRRPALAPSPASFERITRRRPDEHQRHRPAPGDGRGRAAAARRAARRGPAAARARGRRRRRGRHPGGPDRGDARRPTTDEAERVARAIANSPLVKTALYGRDPNWGRIAQAAGHGARGRGARGARARTGSRPRSSAGDGAEAEIALTPRARRRRARTSTSAT